MGEARPVRAAGQNTAYAVYDWLTARYTFPCPTGTKVRVRLSSFRTLERVAGPSSPAVFGVRFACACGGIHTGLVTHTELDWAPVTPAPVAFYNVMTGRLESVGEPLVMEGAFRIERGEWPWVFFCREEGEPRGVFPSAFEALLPDQDRVGVAVRCPGCQTTSVNLVSHEHVGVPFFTDPQVTVLDRVYDHELELSELATQLGEAAPSALVRPLR